MSIIKDFLFKISCCHKWEMISRINTYEDAASRYPYKIVATFVCCKCGKFKKIKL